MGVNIVFFKPIWDLGASPYEPYRTILCCFSTILLLVIPFARLAAASRTQYLFVGCTLMPSELQEHLPDLILDIFTYLDLFLDHSLVCLVTH